MNNFVSADRIQVDRIGLRLYWIESRSNLVPIVNAPLGLRGEISYDISSLRYLEQHNVLGYFAAVTKYPVTPADQLYETRTPGT